MIIINNQTITMEEYDPTVRCCGYCYGVGIPLQKCARCSRSYCSRECQKKDWKIGKHKVWCGKAGEKCVDYEIKETETKGLGLFALRDFQRGEKILVERVVATQARPGGLINRDKLLENKNVWNASMALAPLESKDLGAIYMINCAALGDDNEGIGTGLFINFSRVNHDCVGNSNHFYDEDLGVKLLVANDYITVGTEITFSYASKSPTPERIMRMQLRGFTCSCAACKNPDLAAKLDRVLELDDTILNLGSWGKAEHAIQAGKSLIKLYDELKATDMLYSRTYYDLYQVAITKQKTVKQGIVFIKEAYEHGLRFYGREENEQVQKFKRYVNNPSLHPSYRCIN